jgi:hypothetical protein
MGSVKIVVTVITVLRSEYIEKWKLRMTLEIGRTSARSAVGI